jgi:hypothetical protein
MLCALALVHGANGANLPTNLFANPSFELGRDGWQASKAGQTSCEFKVDDVDAAHQQHSAWLRIDRVEEWGVQFGQSFPAGQKGKTYSFSLFARSVWDPVEVGLAIERNARPWDRAVSGRFKLSKEWQELHVTFKLEKDFPEGWFAYLSCNQAPAQLRVDMVRLSEGPYVPFNTIAAQESLVAGVRLFDTGAAAQGTLSGDALLKRSGWTEIPEDTTPSVLKGAAVLLNDRLALCVRRGTSGVELYSLGPDTAVCRAVLRPARNQAPVTVSSVSVVENSPSAGTVETVFALPEGRTERLRFELKLGQAFVSVERQGEARGLAIEAPCRFMVLPDFFADDIVVDAEELRVPAAELPSDNVVLRPSPDRRAIVASVVKQSEDDLRVTLAGAPESRVFSVSELGFGKGSKIWVGVLAGAGIWHQQVIRAEDSGQPMELSWRAPFAAQWRIDWRQQENLTDSWEMLNENPGGTFTKHSLFAGPETVPATRKRWTTVLGEFNYPAWIDPGCVGHLQPLNRPALRFQGPALIYPINRVAATPLDCFTVLDLVRNTLGVGPCEFILDVEAQQSKYKGRATCSVRDTLNPIYAGGQQQARTAEIEKVLQDLMVFIRHIRGRIDGYVGFGHDIQMYLDEQKRGHPELSEPLTELGSLADRIDARVAARREQIKTPEAAAKLVEEFRASVLTYQGPDALAKCRQFTEAWVAIGGNQDELVGECRWVIRVMRQRAALMLAQDPRLSEVAKEIRRRSQEVLRNPAIHEGARH